MGFRQKARGFGRELSRTAKVKREEKYVYLTSL
jgi:hypothetical protein